MVLVLLIYVLYKSFEIDGRSFTHLKSFPLLYLLRNCIVSFIWISRQPALGANVKDYGRRDKKAGYFCPLGVETKGWPFRSKSGT
jgi:hypothetical protein